MRVKPPALRTARDQRREFRPMNCMGLNFDHAVSLETRRVSFSPPTPLAGPGTRMVSKTLGLNAVARKGHFSGVIRLYHKSGFLLRKSHPLLDRPSELPGLILPITFMNPKEPKSRKAWIILACWLLFAAGLLVQFFGPQLKISNRAFVLPEGSGPKANETFDPIGLVEKDRRIRALAALLTATGTVGLGIFYWGALFGKAPRKEKRNRTNGIAIGNEVQQSIKP
jgi:hypothetical protein